MTSAVFYIYVTYASIFPTMQCLVLRLSLNRILFYDSRGIKFLKN